MSKRQTIDVFFKKKDISHSKLRTSVETNVDTSMSIQDYVNKYMNSLSTNKMKFDVLIT